MDYTAQDFISAAKILATCPKERLPLVSGMLAAGGIEVDLPKPPTQSVTLHGVKLPNDLIAAGSSGKGTAIRIDAEAYDILSFLRTQNDTSMAVMASALIKAGYKAFAAEREE